MLFVLYIGHAVVKGEQVHPLDHDGDSSFNLEAYVQRCAQLTGVYVLCIFSCCRVSDSAEPGSLT